MPSKKTLRREPKDKSEMYRNLNPASIGAVASFEELIRQARKANFYGMILTYLRL